MWKRLSMAIAAMGLLVSNPGCTSGPFHGPELPVENHKKHEEGQGPHVPAIPEISLPKADLNWRDCAQNSSSAFEPTHLAPGVTLECATLPATAHERRATRVTVSVSRLRTPLTQPDAAPIVITTGADISSREYLAMFAASWPDSPLTTHPLIAVDRRGLHSSPQANCGPGSALKRRSIIGQEVRSYGVKDSLESLADQASQYVGDCPQYTGAEPGFFDLRHSVNDLESLRELWQGDRIAIIGVGNGAAVALTYAHDYPDHLARLMLDAPPPYGSDAEIVGEQRAAGLEASLHAFAAQCVALQCALGPDPLGRVTRLLTNTNFTMRGDAKGLILEHIATVLGVNPQEQGQTVLQLAEELDRLDELDSGLDTTMMTRFTDGQLLASCNDQRNQPTAPRVKELMQTWSAGEMYPLVGEVMAKSLLNCTGWPTGPALDAPSTYAMPVLASFTATNPMAASSDPGPIKALVGVANQKLGIVSWSGLGYSPLLRSRCTQETTAKYLESGKPEAEQLYCPA